MKTSILNTKRWITLIALFLAAQVHGQQLSPQAIASAGGVLKNSTVEIEFILGEVAHGIFQSPQFIITTGAVQPFATNVVSSIGEYNHEIIQVYPNPTHDHLTVATPYVVDAMEVIDARGNTVMRLDCPKGENLHIISLSELPTGMYFLNIYSEKYSTVRRIVKF